MYHEFEGEEWYAIHEVFYTEDGKIVAWTQNPVDVIAESVEGIGWVLRSMLKDVHEYPVLSYDMEPEADWPLGDGTSYNSIEELMQALDREDEEEEGP
jgi:hypothetical protein